MDNSGRNPPAPLIFHPVSGLVVLLAGVALVLWSLFLDQRPMHNDEAVNGIKFGQLWEHGGYKYDPNEHHGPSLYYATLALSRLTGAPKDFDQFTENRLRITTVLFGVGLILLLPLIADGLGRKATVWAALFTVTSPAIVFYSRYYIHEVLLVCFTFLALGAGWRYWCSRKIGWALVTGAGLGLMHATKETFVIPLAAAALALALNQLWNRRVDAAALPPLRAASISSIWPRRSQSGWAWRCSSFPRSSATLPDHSTPSLPICPGCIVRRALRPIFTRGTFTCTGCSFFTRSRGRSGARR